MTATIERSGTPLSGSTRFSRLLRGKTFEEGTYPVDKLPEKVRDEVLDKHRYDCAPEPSWLTDWIEEDLTNAGYHNFKVYWSAGHCQGDHVQIADQRGSYIDVEDVVKRAVGWKRLKKMVRFLKKRGIDFFANIEVNFVNYREHTTIEVLWDENRNYIVGAAFTPVKDSGETELHDFKSYDVGHAYHGKLIDLFEQNDGVTDTFVRGRGHFITPIYAEKYVEDFIKEVDEAVQRDKDRLESDYLQYLYDEYDYHAQDEQVIEYLNNNGLRFYRNGEEA